MLDTTIRTIDVAETFPLRRHHLRPSLPEEASRYAGDEHPDSIHLGAFTYGENGEELVGVVSFLPVTEQGEESTGVYQLQAVVTLPAVRNEGVGTRLAEHGLTLLLGRGVERVWCDARTSAFSFYGRLGFQAVGEEFITAETGPHFRMVKVLSG